MTFSRWPPKLTTQVGCQKPVTVLSRLKFDGKKLWNKSKCCIPVNELYYINIFQNYKVTIQIFKMATKINN